MRYAILGSGSSANAYIFSTGTTTFIIDNGFSGKEAIRRMKELGFDPDTVSFIFLTHIHSDHLRGVKVLSKKLKVPVISHEKCQIEKFISGRVYKKIPVCEDTEYNFGDVKVFPFSISHDAPFPLGYHFSCGSRSFTLLTDTGRVSEAMYYYVRNAETLFLEANYNPAMLENGPYPPSLKKRIASGHGHLSNNDAINLLNRLAEDGESRVKKVYFCHLSEKNNSPEKLQEDIDLFLKWDREYTICARGAILPGGT